ncbi:MAG: aminomethyl-transferring glycine dehydrogenase [Rickettsiales bacterium]|jgi:glycine dehydrogenase subunit 1|nr:aminomethyl-transferring glycine dehydrogenase [Rickettsiales bacterium]|tara:strand:+ start:20135 stop:21424 length:1290 start_codon:yes stop_codon:yes gene_type:complete
MRYLALTSNDRKEMLAKIGVKDINEIYQDVDSNSLLTSPISDLPYHMGEIEVENHLKKLSKKNRASSDQPFFLGAGCYKHHIPASVDHIIQRSEFLTSYTPYQPEISQGTLATIFQYQSIISLLTGMDVSNASMYDGATSTAEACLMAMRIKKNKNQIALLNNIHPEYIDVSKTFLKLNNANFTDKISDDCAAAIVQYPDFYGNIEDLQQIRQKCDQHNCLMIVVVNEIVSLGLLNAPKMADIVVGEASSIGVGLNFGGPLLGFFACKKSYIRQMPGRICGATTDSNNKPGYVLTLNAREQHIRRDKATSNICSNQGLCATAFTIHASLLGEIGFKNLAKVNHHKACILFDKLSEIKNIKIINNTFFNEITIQFNDKINASDFNRYLLKNNIIGGYAIDNKMIIAVSELTSSDDITKFTSNLEKFLSNE